jgi:hypothetical protein
MQLQFLQFVAPSRGQQFLDDHILPINLAFASVSNEFKQRFQDTFEAKHISFVEEGDINRNQIVVNAQLDDLLLIAEVPKISKNPADLAFHVIGVGVEHEYQLVQHICTIHEGLYLSKNPCGNIGENPAHLTPYADL